MTDQTSIEEPPARQASGEPPPPASSPAGPSRARRYTVNGLIALASVLGVLAMISIWANRLLLNPDNWSSTSTQLLQNSDIRSATANYLVDQLYANVNVPNVLKSQLPSQFQGLADPVSGLLRNAAVQGATYALTVPAVQTLWARANRAAAQTLVAIVNGGTRHVAVNGGEVTLNLGSIVRDVAARLGLPPNIDQRLPPSIAKLTIFKAKQLKLIQDVGNAVKGLALTLTILVPVLYALALILARGRRRRTLLNVGFAIATVGVIGVAGRALLKSEVTNSLVKDQAFRPAAHAVLDIATQILGEIAVGFIIVGVVSVIAAWFAGPAHPAVVSRRFIAPFLRDHPYYTYAILAFVLLLIFAWQPFPATGTPVGIVVFSVLAVLGIAVLRRQTAEEFPASSGSGAAPPAAPATV
ncbi:MAG TPA: hypothetical protein VGI50_00410 [Solirubrobacteraceae bacterium]